ncbi:DNA-binding protein [Xanthomonas melonis]|uniref:DNA-binding protein n=2 Tax=Xanthomonas melonis TaxID=56456 RepID=A0ABS8NTM5_9XANT|nr:DNA-binding protein [Xanthomonas melonis]MCD0258222.1 DNA-binding protein [Xanthomonas melonis]MCD0266426.1 DNA-binding protein [Xanthomonas melonis]
MQQENVVARTPAKQAISTTPPSNVASAAARGLRLREQHGRGGTAIGVARARDLSAQKSLSVQTIRRMHAYFARHGVDKNGKGWADRSAPSAGYIAWLLWGGDAGQRWAEKLLQRLDAAKTGAGTAAPKAAATKQRTAKKTAAKKTSRTSSAKKSSAGKTATSKRAPGGASTRKSGPTSATRKAAGKTAAKKAATKKTVTKKTASGQTAAKKTTAKKTTAKKTTAKKTTAKKTTAKKTTAKKTTAKKTATRRAVAGKRSSPRSTANKRAAKTSAPWKKPNPKPAWRSGSLSPAQKARAKQRAKAAGRPYPNLVDNMAVARKGNASKRASGSGAAKNTGGH